VKFHIRRYARTAASIDRPASRSAAWISSIAPSTDGAIIRRRASTSGTAGAEVIYPLADHIYGERGGRLGDPFGNQWMLAARIETITPAELAAREPA
jgi:hypothetical protein